MNDEDFVTLLKLLVPFAKTTLKKRGTFLPYAATVATNGQAAMWGAYEDAKTMDSAERVRFLAGALGAHSKSGAIRAACICFDVKARLPGYDGEVDAICSHVEDSSGVAKQVFSPYKKGFLGRTKFSPPVALIVKPMVFGDQ